MKWNAAKAKRKLDKLWSTIIHKRDKWCMICGKVDGVLNAHHINSRSHIATRWDVRNGVLLCFWCHQRVHNDPPWGIQQVTILTASDLFDELYSLAHTIKKFDRIFYEVKLVELQRLALS